VFPIEVQVEILGDQAMRRVLFLLGMVVSLTAVANAQSNTTGSSLLPSSFLLPAPPPSVAPTLQDDVSKGAFPQRGLELGFGYSYFHFNSGHNLSPNLNGFNLSLAYYFKNMLGGEVEMTGALGSQAGQSARFAFVGAGPRVRVTGPAKLEVWVHGLVGYAHYVPQTALGNQGAFGFELGGGVDYRARYWLSYRVAADMIGSTLFSSTQFSPKISAGIVINF
jgi:hypothetical protein